MFKSAIIVTEPNIQIINHENVGMKYIDLRDKSIYDLRIILPSLMYNHLIILKLDEDLTRYLNVYGIGFTEVYQEDSETELYSKTLNYYCHKIKLKNNILDYVKFYEYISNSRNDLYASGWNACQDYIRKENEYKKYLENEPTKSNN